MHSLDDLRRNDARIDLREFLFVEQFPERNTLPKESQAALRQFSLERMVGYGLALSDAMELQLAVANGDGWRDSAVGLADAIIARGGERPSKQTRIGSLYRASAMKRMAQIMTMRDDDVRHRLYREASLLFEEAATLSAESTRHVVETPYGELTAWVYQPIGDPLGMVILIGGVEGWGMDHRRMALYLRNRGIEAWALDGPGQGESRLVHEHFLHPQWRRSYRALIDHMQKTRPDLPIGFFGNSMGATFALEIASCEPAIVACCANGGVLQGVRPLRDFDAMRPKMQQMCGPVGDDASKAIWSDIDILAHGPSVTCPVLIVHGGLDPLISDEESWQIFDSLGSDDKRLVAFNDGNHCVYNHPEERNALASDWFAEKLSNSRS